MDLLINIKKSEDINRYIKYIEQKIKIAEDNNNLSEAKDLLKNKNFLEALYLYILDKKYKNEVPLLLEYANDIINDILELYVPLKEKIDKLVLDTNKSISINDMNTWLNNLFLIYKKHGKEITINDFKEIFPKSMEDDNKLIFEYMSIYFKNINNKDESIYNDAIFKYCTLSDDINNPVLNIMGKAIDTLNQKNNSYLEEEYHQVKNMASTLFEYNNIDSKNIHELKEYVDTTISKYLNNRVDFIEGKDLKVKKEYELNKDKIAKLNNDIGLVNLCNKITNFKYSAMGNENKQELYNDLNQIISIIIKYKLALVSMQGLSKYIDDSDYDNISNAIIDLSNKQEKINSEIDDYQRLYDSTLQRKTGLRYTNKKKLSEIDIISRKQEELKKELQDIIAKRNEVNQEKEKFMNDLYSELDLSLFINNLGLKDILDKDKLFGLFEFENLRNIDNDLINKNSLLLKYGIVLDNTRPEFGDLVNMCINHITDKNLTNQRLYSDIDDKELFSIASGEYDYLIEQYTKKK